MPLEKLNITIDPNAYSRITDYFDAWCMYEPAFNGLKQTIEAANLPQHIAAGIAARRQMDEGPGYTVLEGGVAVVSVTGTMMKAETSFGDGASTVAVRAALRAAVRDPNVSAILMQWDTPGGTVAGTSDLAAEIRAAAAAKPMSGYIEDMCASAGYWGASQCGFIACGPASIGGSIGTFMRVADSSAAAKEAGVDVYVVKAGDFKGAGTPGTEVTDEQLAEWQRMINSLNTQFVNDALINGRGMSAEQAKILADGRVHVGQELKTLGLVDAVQSFDDTVRQLIERAGAKTTGGANNAASTKGKKMSATLQELKAGCVGADADFLLAQLEAGATVEQAQANFKFVSDLKASHAKQLADAKVEATAGTLKTTGVDPLGSGDESTKGKKGQQGQAETHDDDPVAEFNALVAEKMAKSTNPNAIEKRQAAIRAATRENPVLHARYLQAQNPDFKEIIGSKARSYGVKAV